MATLKRNGDSEDPLNAKVPRSAYSCYAQANRTKMLESLPGAGACRCGCRPKLLLLNRHVRFLGAPALNTALAEGWKNLSTEEREIYEAESAQDKKRFEVSSNSGTANAGHFTSCMLSPRTAPVSRAQTELESHAPSEEPLRDVVDAKDDESTARDLQV